MFTCVDTLNVLKTTMRKMLRSDKPKLKKCAAAFFQQSCVEKEKENKALKTSGCCMAAEPEADGCWQALHEQDKRKIPRCLFVRFGVELI